MSTLKKIAEWATTRPLWQQAAVQRIYETGALGPEELSTMVYYCKAEHGLATNDVEIPKISFGDESETGVRPSVRIRSISETTNVNALRAHETLTFGDSGLTLVFGDNGVGKSSYVRILKQVCRTRGAVAVVHPFAYEADERPSAARITYDLDSALGIEFEWSVGTDAPEALREVSILDSESALVYTDSEQDVAYLPGGLDILVRLAAVCDSVAEKLHAEVVIANASVDKFEEFHRDGRLAEALKNLKSSKSRDILRILRNLSESELARVHALNADLAVLRSGNVEQQVNALAMQKARVGESRAKLERLRTIISENFAQLSLLRERYSDLSSGVEKITTETFESFPIQGLNHESWKALWAAAKSFASDGASPTQVFPSIAGALCLLCQQEVGHDAARRMHSFAEFAKSELSAEANTAKLKLEQAVRDLLTNSAAILFDQTSTKELNDLSDGFGDRFDTCVQYLRSSAAALAANVISASPVDVAVAIISECASLELRIETTETSLRELSNAGVQVAREEELALLNERLLLDQVWPRVETEIARIDMMAKLQQCLLSTKTNSITSKGKELLASEVTAPLATSFSQNLADLHISHIPIAFAPAKGKKGSALHRVELEAVLSVPNSQVLSEGECRAIAIAGFFAEATVQGSKSTLIFDDPVSSLDLSRREVVARALVELAKARPVVVFTHDMPFAWQITTCADDVNVLCTERQLRRAGSRTGVVSDSIEGSGVGARKRIGPVKHRAAQLQKIYDNDPANYDREARTLYGELREIWERSVEDVLFNGALRRFGKEVKTQSLTKLHLLTADHIDRLTAGMSKCSGLLIGHDQAAALGRPVPEPSVVRADVEECENWMKEIVKLYG